MGKGRSQPGKKSNAGPSILVKHFHGLVKEGKALDLSCGQGKNAVFLAEHGFEVIALNDRQENLEKAIQYAEKSGVSIDFRTAEPQDFKIHKSRYSIIAAYDVFHHLKKSELEKKAPEIAAGLKKGGILIGTSFSVDDPLLKELRKKHVPEIEKKCFMLSNDWIASFFDKREILGLFPDLQTLYYAETDSYESGAWRGLVEFVLRKK